MKRDKARLWLASAPQGDGSRVYAYIIKDCHGRTWQSKRGRKLADTPCDPSLTEHSFNPPHDAYGSFYLVYHQAQPQDAGLHPRLRTAVHIGQTERGRSPTVCCRMGRRSAGMLLKSAGRHKHEPLPEPFLTRASHARPL